MGCLQKAFTLERRALGIMGGFLGATTVLALIVTELGPVIDLNGSIAGTSITFIVPGLVYYLLHKDHRTACIGRLALAMMAFGAVLVPVSLTVAFLPDGAAAAGGSNRTNATF